MDKKQFMEQQQLESFITVMTQSMLDAGEMAITSQKNIVNVGKEEEVGESESDLTKQRRQAKTIIDEQVQELLLQRVQEVLPITSLNIDAEEDTPSRNSFTNKNAELTLIIDPIDGTLEYLLGHDSYSICVGLVSKGEILTALVYFPVRKTFYFIDVDKKVYLSYYSEYGKLLSTEQLHSPIQIKGNTVYINHHIAAGADELLKEKGFTVIKDIDGDVVWPDALLSCISGEYKAAMFANPQIRDILLGVMIEKMEHGYAVDFKGQKIEWPNGGRVSEVMFGFGMPDEKIVKLL